MRKETRGAGGVLEVIKMRGPSTESEIVNELKRGSSIESVKSELHRVHRRGELFRAGTEENGRLVYLYYIPEQEESLVTSTRNVWVPLRQRDQSLKNAIDNVIPTIMTKSMKVNLAMVSAYIGFPPDEIKGEFYAAIKDAGLKTIDGLNFKRPTDNSWMFKRQGKR